MPTLLSLLDTAHFTRSSGFYHLHPDVVSGYTLGAGSLQLDKRAYYPVERHTPGGAVLGGANLAQAIRNAADAAQGENGGVILIPPGDWEIGDEEIHIIGAGRTKPVAIQGAGMDVTNIILPTGYSGELFFLQGTSPDGFWFNGGISDLTIQCESEDESNTGTALHTEGCINPQFRNLTIRNLTAGKGWYATRGDPDFTNQYVQGWNVTVAGCGYNYHWRSVVNSQFYGLYSGSARIRDFVCDDVKASIYGGYIQSSPDIAVELDGEGGCRLVIYDFYYESNNTDMTMFKCNPPSVTYNILEVHGFHLGGGPAIFLDTDGTSTGVVLDQVYSIGQAAKIVKARNGSPITLINSGSPISTPSKFDLDAASAAVLVAVEPGTNYVGGKHYAINAFALPAANENSEPASPTDGDLRYNASSNRPRVRASSTWRDLAYADDSLSLTDLLAPYAADIFDPRMAAKRSVSSGELVSLTGLVAGNVISAPSSGQRPTFTTADDDFAGNASFTCENASSGKFLGGSLSPTIASNSYPGLFIVGRVVTPKGGSGRCFLAAIENAGHTVSMAISADDVNAPGHWGSAWVSTNVTISVASAGIDTAPHVYACYSDPPQLGAQGVRFDLEALHVDAPGAGGGSAAAIDTLHIGAGWNSSAYEGGDVTIAYLAVLKSVVPVSVMTRAISLARARFGVY